MYEIPKQLRKYTAKFLVGTFKQDITGILVIVLCLALLRVLPFSLVPKIIVVAVIILAGVVFLAFKLDEKIANLFQFHKSTKKATYYDPRMDNFIQLSKVRDGVVYMKNSMMVSILKVTPIDFSILSADEQQDLIKRFEIFLMSFDYPVQITSRSVTINLDYWLHNSELKLRQSIKEKQTHRVEQFNSFKHWMKSSIELSTIRNRVFYIVIPYLPKTALVSFKKRAEGINMSEKDLIKNLKELDDRVSNCLERLNTIGFGFTAERMYDSELVALFSSYFTNIEGVNIGYVTPVTWPLLPNE